MSVVTTLRSMIRHELRARRPVELGEVTAVHPMAGDDGNHQVHIQLQGSETELQYVPVVAMRAGLSALPALGDLVAVAFAGGDFDRPLVLGTLYSDRSRPPEAAADEVVYQPTEAEDPEVRRVHVELPSGLTLTLADEEVSVVAGATEVRISRDGDVVIKAQGAVQVEAAGDLGLKAGGAMNLEATGDLNLSGAQVAIEGQGAAKLKAPSITVAGQTALQPS